MFLHDVEMSILNCDVIKLLENLLDYRSDTCVKA